MMEFKDETIQMWMSESGREGQPVYFGDLGRCTPSASYTRGERFIRWLGQLLRRGFRFYNEKNPLGFLSHDCEAGKKATIVIRREYIDAR